MKVTFSKNPMDRFLVWYDNTYEKFLHWYWNKSPHHVRCRICGEVITSEAADSPSPEERGWKCTKVGSAEIICEYGDRHIKCYGDLELRKSQSDLDGDEYSVEIKVQ